MAIEELATRSDLSIDPARQAGLPQPELRDLFDSLRRQLAFQPAEAAVDVGVALFADEPPDRRRKVAEVQSVPLWNLPPAGTGRRGRKLSNTFVQVEGTYTLGA